MHAAPPPTRSDGAKLCRVVVVESRFLNSRLGQVERLVTSLLAASSAVLLPATRWLGAGRERLAGVVSVGLGSWFVSFVLYAPPFWTILEPGRLAQSRAGDFLKLCRDPLARDLTEQILAYRLTVPVISWLLHLPDWLSLLLPYVFLSLSLGLVYEALRLRTTEVYAAWVAVGLACTYMVIWPSTKPGFPDGVTHFAVAACLVTAAPGWAAALTVFGMMNDERFITAVPFILLWHGWPVPSVSAAIRQTWRLAAGFVLGVGIVWILRKALTDGWIGPGIPRLEVYSGIGAFWSEFPDWARRWAGTFVVNVGMGWRWLWLPWMAGVFWIWRGLGPRWWIGTAAVGTLLSVLATMVVADVSRSVGYLFPALVAVLGAAYRENPARAERWLILAVIACALTPGFYLTDQMQWSRPLPFSLLRYWTGWDLLNLLR